MRQLRAIQQHDRGGEFLLRPPRLAEDGLAFHVAVEKLGDVADGEDVGIDHHGPAPIAHQLGRHETQGRERLEIVVAPHPHLPFAQEGLPLARLEERMVLAVDDADLEAVRAARVALEGIARDERAHELLVVGVDEDGRGHAVPLAEGPSGFCAGLYRQRAATGQIGAPGLDRRAKGRYRGLCETSSPSRAASRPPQDEEVFPASSS